MRCYRSNCASIVRHVFRLKMHICDDLGLEKRSRTAFLSNMIVAVGLIYAGTILFCVGTTAWLLRTWTRKRYWRNSAKLGRPDDRITGDEIAGFGGEVAMRSGSRKRSRIQGAPQQTATANPGQMD
jgi:hypothetical protein